MSDVSIITTSVTALALGLMLANAKRKGEQNEDGHLVLKFPKIFLFIGPLAWAMLIIGLFQSPPEQNKVLLVVILFLTIGLGGIYITLYALNFSAIIGSKGIVAKSYLGKTMEMEWAEIDSIKFIRFRNELRIKSSKGKFYVSMYLRGYPELIRLIESHTSFTKSSMKIPKGQLR